MNRMLFFFTNAVDVCRVNRFLCDLIVNWVEVWLFGGYKSSRKSLASLNTAVQQFHEYDVQV